MFEVGRLCVKLAGRDAGKKCVIVDVIDDSHAVVDGETRRRKVNVKHLDPTKETLDLKGTDHAAVVDAFNQLGLKALETKPKKSKPKAKQMRAADRKKMAKESASKKVFKKDKKVAPKKEDVVTPKLVPKEPEAESKPADKSSVTDKPSVEEKLAEPKELEKELDKPQDKADN